MRPWSLQHLAGCSIWYASHVEALAPQPGPDSMSGKMKPAPSTVILPNFGFAPLPTPRPLLPDNAQDLRKRQANPGEICGYVSGDASSPFGCNPSSTCRTDTRLSQIHCCPATLNAGASCIAATACLDATAYSSILRTATTTDPIPIETGWCSATQYMYCVQYIFAEVPIRGYTWIQCGGKPTLEAAILSATKNVDTPSSSSRLPLTPTTPTTTVTPTPTPPAASSTPTGAIVGGVVGGLAVIGLLILGLFYINRRKRNTEEPPAPQQPEVGYPPGPESPPLGYGPPADYRGSMFKAPYETTSAASPPISPTYPASSGNGAGAGITQYHTPPPNEGVHYQTPPPAADSGITQAQAQPQPQYQPVAQYPPPVNSGIPHQSQPGQPPVYPDQRYELPIDRGDGEVRELRG